MCQSWWVDADAKALLLGAFARDLESRRGIDPRFLPGYRQGVEEFLLSYADRPPVELVRADLDRMLDGKRSMGAKDRELRNLEVAGQAFLDFQASGRASAGVAALRAAAREGPEAPVASFDGRAGPEIWASFQALLSFDGFTTALGVAVPLFIDLLFYPVGSFVHLLGLATYFFMLLRAHGMGIRGAGIVSLDGDHHLGWFGTLLQAGAILLLGVGPMVGGVVAFADAGPAVAVAAAAGGALLGAALVPAAAMAVFAGGNAILAFNPFAWARIAGRMPRDYGTAVLWVAPAGTVAAITYVLASTTNSVLIGLPFAVVYSFAVLVVAAVVGTVIHVHAVEFGLDRRSSGTTERAAHSSKQ